MKKSILAIAVMALVSVTASAASISWSTTALSFGGTTLKSNTSVTSYLIYLADGTVPSFSFDNTFAPGSIGTLVASNNDGTTRKGASVGSFSYALDDTGKGDYENGDAFTLLVSYTTMVDGKAQTFWNISSDIQTLSGMSDISSVYEGPDYAFNNTINATNTLTAGGGWAAAAAVPEPATGAIALAGLALLFRRKRA